ncbi:unnamed protein product [Notodromas monacha]|uniref:Uncharacterized protein n=1 Tax=Notodromas monacha TaxID=399045 RepID=A0A7R9BPZ6_9CRUS|nr:unnamed protein product [Notodromas monacha]CAG0918184.1 unnamed protein product [Notodromas monacha]
MKRILSKAKNKFKPKPTNTRLSRTPSRQLMEALVTACTSSEQHSPVTMNDIKYSHTDDSKDSTTLTFTSQKQSLYTAGNGESEDDEQLDDESAENEDEIHHSSNKASKHVEYMDEKTEKSWKSNRNAPRISMQDFQHSIGPTLLNQSDSDDENSLLDDDDDDVSPETLASNKELKTRASFRKPNKDSSPLARALKMSITTEFDEAAEEQNHTDEPTSYNMVETTNENNSGKLEELEMLRARLYRLRKRLDEADYTGSHNQGHQTIIGIEQDESWAASLESVYLDASSKWANLTLNWHRTGKLICLGFLIFGLFCFLFMLLITFWRQSKFVYTHQMHPEEFFQPEMITNTTNPETTLTEFPLVEATDEAEVLPESIHHPVPVFKPGTQTNSAEEIQKTNDFMFQLEQKFSRRPLKSEKNIVKIRENLENENFNPYPRCGLNIFAMNADAPALAES